MSNLFVKQENLQNSDNVHEKVIFVSRLCVYYAVLVPSCAWYCWVHSPVTSLQAGTLAGAPLVPRRPAPNTEMAIFNKDQSLHQQTRKKSTAEVKFRHRHAFPAKTDLCQNVFSSYLRQRIPQYTVTFLLIKTIIFCFLFLKSLVMRH